MGKFYIVSNELSKKLRKSKLSRNEMNLWLYLTEQDPFGDKYWELPPTLEITEELEMSKASYFRARARLQELGLFDFQEQRVDCRNLAGVSKMRLDDQKLDSKSQKNSSGSQKSSSESQKRENQDSKPLPNKDSGTSHTNKTYKDFADSLSVEERESFLEFGVKMASDLPKPPQLPKKWIVKNWEEVRDKWLLSRNKPSTEQTHKWADHPNREEWLNEINQLGAVTFMCDDEGNVNPERQEFFEWAQKAGLIE